MERFIALDLETTGLDPARDTIIEIGAVRFENGAPVSKFHRLVNPRRPIPPAITRLTGICQRDVSGASPLEEALPDLDAFCEDLTLAAHNQDFECSFLAQTNFAASLGRPERWIDTYRLARLIVPSMRSFRLSCLARDLELSNAPSHRANDDALVCGQLLAKLQSRLCEWDLDLLDELLRLSKGLSDSVRSLFSLALTAQASKFSSRAIRRLPVAAPAASSLEEDSVSGPAAAQPPADLFEAFLDPGGALSNVLGGYEERPGQKRMQALVSEALAEGRHLLVEAGTGVGKSVAYLVPALYWSLSSGQRVVVSTGTIQLQEQLWEKDIPLLQRATGLPWNAALVKGRGNYLCLRRWREAVEEGEPFWNQGERWFFLRLAAWAAQTGTGDRSELDPTKEEEEAWAQVNSEAGNCLWQRCSWFRLCFFQRSRRAAESANLIIANHSLVVSDIKTGNNLLPEYRYLVIDEAHRLEATASEHLGPALNLLELDRQLSALNRRPGNGRPGLLTRLRGLGPISGLDDLTALTAEARGLAGRLSGALDELFRAQPGVDDDYPQALRLGPWVDNRSEWQILCEARDLLANSLNRLAGALIQPLDDLPRRIPDDERRAALQLEIERAAGRASDQAGIIQGVLQSDLDGRIRWIEPFRQRSSQGYILRSVPLDIGPELNEKLWQPLNSVILTSATLSVRGKFDHLEERLGLRSPDLASPLTAAVESPFSYPEQVLVCLPEELPDPRESSQAVWAEQMDPLIHELLLTTGGRALVLFTSHRLLRNVYGRLKDRLEAAGLPLLGQGIDGGRSRLAAALREMDRAVVFGASSFWEGVDVPGPGLSCVVLVRLPFQPPTQPILAARSEALERRGVSPFYKLSLPDAVIKFRQGFGRLIRSRSDRGVVVVLDPRFDPSRSGYGRIFFDCLPGPSFKRAPWPDLKTAINSWLRSQANSEVNGN